MLGRAAIVLALLSFISAQRTFKFTGDDIATMYIDGKEVVPRHNVLREYIPIDPTQCYTSIAVKVENIVGPAMIIASFDDGTVTDSSWKVSLDEHSGWANAFYDDSLWADAYQITDKTDPTSPWVWVTPSTEIADAAYFIWTQNWDDGDMVVYFRKTFDDCKKYNCGNRNPCDPLLIPDLYYYAHFDQTMFVQCDPFGGCSEKECLDSEVWNEDFLTCILPLI